jgi:hypothetical protein
MNFSFVKALSLLIIVLISNLSIAQSGKNDLQASIDKGFEELEKLIEVEDCQNQEVSKDQFEVSRKRQSWMILQVVCLDESSYNSRIMFGAINKKSKKFKLMKFKLPGEIENNKVVEYNVVDTLYTSNKVGSVDNKTFTVELSSGDVSVQNVRLLTYKVVTDKKEVKFELTHFLLNSYENGEENSTEINL